MEQLTKNQAVATSQEAVQNQDRKSGSAGMPRPISYAVFCLKKKSEAAMRLPNAVRKLNAATAASPIDTIALYTYVERCATFVRYSFHIYRLPPTSTLFPYTTLFRSC